MQHQKEKMPVKLRPEIWRTTADFTSKLSYELERNASLTSYLFISPVKRSLRSRLSPHTVQYLLEVVLGRQIRLQQSFSTDLRLCECKNGRNSWETKYVLQGFLHHKNYLWLLWATQVSKSHRNCLNLIEFWWFCLPSWRGLEFPFLSFTSNRLIVLA